VPGVPLAGFAGASMLLALLLPVAAVTALFAVRVWHKPARAAKTGGVHPSFPLFIRITYAWLLIAAALWIAAVWADHGGGIWGAARQAGPDRRIYLHHGVLYRPANPAGLRRHAGSL